MLDNQLDQLLSQFVGRQIGASDFLRDFAGLYFAVRQSQQRKQRASQLCNQIIGPLAEYSRGDRSEESLREEVATAARSFANPERNIVVMYIQPEVAEPNRVAMASYEIVLASAPATRAKWSEVRGQAMAKPLFRKPSNKNCSTIEQVPISFAATA